MAKIKAIIYVSESDVKEAAELDSLHDAISRELGWLHDSGMFIETWDYLDRSSRFSQNSSGSTM